MREYHVSPSGCDNGPGTEENPFCTISKAARTAVAGDRVIVHEGVYREWVRPANGGTGSICRITYEAAKGEKAVIKGSERIKNWELVEGTVWKTVLPESFFGDYNPYKEVLGGDWFMNPEDYPVHTGEIYLNGKSFYEAASLEEVKHPVMRTKGAGPSWAKQEERLLHPEDSIYQWYTESVGTDTVIYANFQGADPNRELTEINVRKCCFYPAETGKDYITVRGFEMAHAACPWTPPTADQPALLGTHWSKGWIIEDNYIHDAKCSGISIGKEASTGHNKSTRTGRMPGYQYQLEAVFLAAKAGWSREKVGSHIIRGNTICDCGQNAVVGHLGCIFSDIHHNHIYNIGVKHEFFGYEIAGIKLHAAIDTQIHHNRIHHCTLGTWLDWQAQGTRLSRNLYDSNDRDLMVEVTHGPYMVDDNIFGSEYNLDNVAQGGAYLHNLFCGAIYSEEEPERATPYHFPHSTDIAGAAVVFGRDDRFYQNIFLGGEKSQEDSFTYGTIRYEGSPASIEEYIEEAASKKGGDTGRFRSVKQPVYVNGNVYFGGALACGSEKHNFISEKKLEIRIEEEGDKVFLEMGAEQGIFDVPTKIYGTEDLEMTRITEAAYEAPDGSFIRLDTDYLGEKRGSSPVPGPLENLKEGRNRICIWSK